MDFGASKKPCPTPVTVRTVPGEPAAAGAAPAACPACGAAMEGRGVATATLWHLPMGMDGTRVEVAGRRWARPSCGRTRMEPVPFKAEGHR